MENLHPHLAKKPRIIDLDYELEDGTPIKGQGLAINGLIKSVGTKEKLMNNRKQTPYRTATVESWNPKTQQVETKPAVLIQALLEATEDSFTPDSEVEVLLELDPKTGDTYGKVQLPKLETFDYADYASAVEEVTETA